MVKTPQPQQAGHTSSNGGSAVLLVVDMINDLNFPDNQELVRRSEQLGKTVRHLKKRCREAGIPTIYVNDNLGKWRSDFASIVRRCTAPESPGAPMVKQMLPEQEDLLVLKPKHSVFYGTPLDELLQDLQARSLIIVGLSTHSCILVSVSDAYMRGYRIFVPNDCVAGQSEREHSSTLRLMESNFKVITSASSELDLLSLHNGQ
jgi:nicotinamidase-related amidase